MQRRNQRPEVIRIGDRLRMARRRAGLTQSDLGKKVRVTGVAISYWENGANEPTIANLKMLCDVLDITLGWLLFGDATAGGYINCERLTPGVEQTLLATIGTWPLERRRQFSRSLAELAEAVA